MQTSTLLSPPGFTCRNCFPNECEESTHHFRRPWTERERKIADDWGIDREAARPKSESSNLGAWEINVELEHWDNLAQKERFRKSLPERQAWLSYLPEIEESAKRVERFRNCGADSWVMRHKETGELKLQVNACKLRICPVCRRARQARASKMLRAMLEDAKPREYQMITLTLRHNDQPLKDRLRFLRTSFRKLRHRNGWKKSAQFGYAVLEINWSDVSGCWHPHLHILVRTQFIDWTRLRKDWIQITHGSHHVNSQIVHKPGPAADYLVKYLGKPPDTSILDNPERAAEYYRAIDRCKLILPFGNPPKPEEKPKSLYHREDWTAVASMQDLIMRAGQDDHDSLAILEELAIARQETHRFFHHIDGTIHTYNCHDPPKSK